MNPAPTLDAPVATDFTSLLGQATRAAWGRLSWRTAGATAAIGLALSLWSVIDVTAADIIVPRSFVAATVTTLIVTCSMMMTTLVADELVSAGLQRLTAYGLAVVAGCALGALVQSLVLDWLGLEWWHQYPDLDRDMFRMQPAGVFFEYLIWGSIIVSIYVSRRGALRAAQRLSAARVELAETRRRAMQARLQAVQARVEPRFLFDSLARVRDLYDSDPAQGGRMLSDLIVYLRAALPHMRESVSTVRHELELVRAYLTVARSAEAMHVDLDVPESAFAARMPAMVLLPLVNRIRERHGGLASSLDRVAITLHDAIDSIRFEIECEGERNDGAAGFHDIEQRLDTLYGSAWRLDVRCIGRRLTRTTLEIPYDSADRGHC